MRGNRGTSATNPFVLTPSGSCQLKAIPYHMFDFSQGGMIRLGTLIELKFLNSSFSSSNLSTRAFRACPLVEIGRTVPCRAIRGNSISVNSTLPPFNVAVIDLCTALKASHAVAPRQYYYSRVYFAITITITSTAVY